LGLGNIGAQTSRLMERMKGRHYQLNGGWVRLTKNHDVVHEHEVSELEAATLWMKGELWLFLSMGHETGEVLHGKDEE